MFVSRYTGQTIIRYFMDEDDACDYINFVVSHDPRELLELSWTPLREGFLFACIDSIDMLW